MLFDTSPVEDDDGGGKKKPRKKAKQAATVAVVPDVIVDEQATNYLASIDAVCDRCGMTVLDLVDTRKTEAGQKWLVQCGWGCGLLSLIDPVPGVLDAEDRKQAPDAFRMRGGRFDGKTFAEIDAEGCRWYIESLVTTSKRKGIADAAKKYLTGSQ